MNTSRRSLLSGVAGVAALGFTGAASASAATSSTDPSSYGPAPAFVVWGNGGKDPGVHAYNMARTHIGAPYVYGAKGPNSFDCSGLVRYSVWQATGYMLPESSEQQYAAMASLGIQQVTTPKLGDLVYFYGYEGGYSWFHTGFYKDSKTIVAAPKPGDHVREAVLNMVDSRGNLAKQAFFRISIDTIGGWNMKWLNSQANPLSAPGLPYHT